MGPMDGGGPAGLLASGVGGGGMGGIGPTIPQALMPQGGMPGIPGGGADPQKIMAYIQALRGGGMSGAAGGGGGGGGGGFNILKMPGQQLPGGTDYSGPMSNSPLVGPWSLF